MEGRGAWRTDGIRRAWEHISSGHSTGNRQQIGIVVGVEAVKNAKPGHGEPLDGVSVGCSPQGRSAVDTQMRVGINDSV